MFPLYAIKILFATDHQQHRIVHSLWDGISLIFNCYFAIYTNGISEFIDKFVRVFYSWYVDANFINFFLLILENAELSFCWLLIFWFLFIFFHLPILLCFCTYVFTLFLFAQFRFQLLPILSAPVKGTTLNNAIFFSL